MENIDIARALEEVADLLSIQGANPFRVSAYRTGAQVVAAHGESLRALVEQRADLSQLPHIGKDLAHYIEELVRTGKLRLLEELRAEIPPSLVELTRLPMLGPKRARQLWLQLGVTNLEELERAARAGRIASLAGFGERSQQGLLEALASRERARRYGLAEADAYVAALVQYMRQAPGIEQLAVAGSYRRRLETIGDLDLLATAVRAKPVMDHFVSWSAVAHVISQGSTRSSVVLRSGLQVDLRVVRSGQFGAALAYFTGSKAHNIKVRRRGIERGLRISEYGAKLVGTRKPAGAALEIRDEEELYRAVDLPWIPPELREDRGEVEAAAAAALPSLVQLKDLRGDLQMHSTWSDGKNSLEEMVTACVQRGYQYMAITDHGPTLRVTRGLDATRIKRQWAELEEIAARHPEIRILRSMEVDIQRDGSLDMPEAVLAQLDLVVISVHTHFQLSEGEQTKRVLRALQHPQANLLAHPTGRSLGKRPPIKLALEEILHCAREHHVALEINAQPERLDLNDRQARRAGELGVMLVVDSDAHSVKELELLRYGVDQARRAWLEQRHVLNTWPLPRVLRALRKP